MPESKQNKGLLWQTYESRPTEFQGFFDLVANPPLAGLSQNETAAPTGIGSGGNESGKASCVSKAEDYRTPRIISTHFGLGDDDWSAAGR